MGWVSHLEYFWKEPRFARFLERLASFSRLILFDKRGTGLSDPVPVSQLPTLEERLDDVRAVMDAVGSERAALMGVSEGGPLCTLFAATYPEKTESLVMIGSYARRFSAPDYPWGQTPEESAAFCRTILDDWGGPVGIDARAPSLAGDAGFRQWWASYLRMGASPGAAVALTEMNAQIDVRNVLPCVRVPTLVLHRADDRCLKAGGARYLASQIPGAEYVELPGADHLPFVGDQDAMLREIESFLARTHVRATEAHALATVLVVLADDEAGSRRRDLERAFDQEVAAHRGERLAALQGRLAATFDGPSRAVRCGRAVATVADRLGAPVHAAVHVGELDPSSAAGLVDVTAGIAAAAPPGVVVASRTVVDLVPGSGLRFAEHGAVRLEATGRDMPLFSVG
jgi:pimeloyl-ACP methyl ester carboxylesterase